jgi:hypothetical protein
MLERINVPAKYACSAPYIRLEGDFCGSPLSGLYLLWAVAGVPIRTAGELLSEGAVSEPRELVAVCLFLLLTLPFLSTLLLLLRGERHGRMVFHFVAWGLAGALSVFLLAVDWHGRTSLRLWGPWLYAGVAVAVLAGEIVAARLRPGREARPAAAGAD